MKTENNHRHAALSRQLREIEKRSGKLKTECVRAYCSPPKKKETTVADARSALDDKERSVRRRDSAAQRDRKAP